MAAVFCLRLLWRIAFVRLYTFVLFTNDDPNAHNTVMSSKHMWCCLKRDIVKLSNLTKLGSRHVT